MGRATFAGALHQGDDGAYVNFLGDEGQERVRAAYPGATWDRLAAVKATLRPGQPVPPQPERAARQNPIAVGHVRRKATPSTMTRCPLLVLRMVSVPERSVLSSRMATSWRRLVVDA